MANEHIARLRVPPVQSKTFQRNYIQVAVLELRFPTLLELESKAPIELQKALRKEYPHFSKQRAVSLESTPVEAGARYLFTSRDQKWTVTLKPDALAIETPKYESFERLMDRATHVLEASRSQIDSDFFTRVGLRYVNVIPVRDGDFSGWMNSSLVAAVEQGVYGTLLKYWQEVRGYSEAGFYSFRHGFPEEAKEDLEYVLDFDFYNNNIESDKVLSVAGELHQQSFAMFLWSLGPKALALLDE